MRIVFIQLALTFLSVFIVPPLPFAFSNTHARHAVASGRMVNVFDDCCHWLLVFPAGAQGPFIRLGPELVLDNPCALGMSLTPVMSRIVTPWASANFAVLLSTTGLQMGVLSRVFINRLILDVKGPPHGPG